MRTSRRIRLRKPLQAALVLALLPAPTAFPQAAPAAASPTPPDDAPKVGVGVTIFTDFAYTDAPKIKDSDGNLVSKSEFEVRRAYLNVTGQLNRLLSFRITPDVASRQSTTASATNLPSGTSVTAANSLDGSLTIRLKYAYGQFNLDDVLKSKGSWVRFGQQQTPFVTFAEDVYRYRFQGPVFADREGYLSSSDVGLSAHYNLPNQYGDVHAGFYNGDTYAKAEPNDRKAFQIRGTLRPLPKESVLKGLRLTAFYDHDSPVRSGARTRFIGNLTFEHPHLNLGFDCLGARDRPGAKPAVESQGWSVWVTPRTNVGIEGLFRHDDLKPDKAVGARNRRTLVGVAYWFRLPRPSLAAAILGDYEQVRYDSALDKPTEKRLEVKTLFGF